MYIHCKIFLLTTTSQFTQQLFLDYIKIQQIIPVHFNMRWPILYYVEVYAGIITWTNFKCLKTCLTSNDTCVCLHEVYHYEIY